MGTEIERSGCPATLSRWREVEVEFPPVSPGDETKKAAASLRPEFRPVWERILPCLPHHHHYNLLVFFVTIKIFVLLFSMVLASVFTLADKNVSCR
jgi:hypothetical protein